MSGNFEKYYNELQDYTEKNLAAFIPVEDGLQKTLIEALKVLALKAGSFLGIAFQLRDDIFNKIGIAEELGKTTGNDEAKGKSNYVAVHGLDEAQKKVIDLSSRAAAIFTEFYKARGIEYAFLSELASQFELRKI